MLPCGGSLRLWPRRLGSGKTAAYDSFMALPDSNPVPCWRPSAWWAIVALVPVFLALYILSFGPVVAISGRSDHPPKLLELTLDLIYAPLEWSYDHSSRAVQRVYDAYIDWWVNRSR